MSSELAHWNESIWLTVNAILQILHWFNLVIDGFLECSRIVNWM